MRDAARGTLACPVEPFCTVGSASEGRGSIVMHGVGLALLGVVAGLAAALPAARLIESLLFDVSPRDPAPLGIVAAFMIVIAALASAIPAMRAARVDPLRVPRADWKSV